MTNPDPRERQWFEVQARVKVLAADEDDAINAVALTLTRPKLKDVFPVAEFDARPCDDPTQRRTRRIAS